MTPTDLCEAASRPPIPGIGSTIESPTDNSPCLGAEGGPGPGMASQPAIHTWRHDAPRACDMILLFITVGCPSHSSCDELSRAWCSPLQVEADRKVVVELGYLALQCRWAAPESTGSRRWDMAG